MANDITITKLVEGPRSAVFHISLFSDGVTGELTNFTLVDPAFDFSPELNTKTRMTIEEIWYEFAGFTSKLQFNYLTKSTPAWTMNGNNSSYIDMRPFGGIKDRTNTLDGNGKLTITTNGFNTLGCQGTIVIKMRKN